MLGNESHFLANLSIQKAEFALDIFAPNKSFYWMQNDLFDFRPCMSMRVLLNWTIEANHICWLYSIFPSCVSQPPSHCISDSLQSAGTALGCIHSKEKTKLDGFLSFYRHVTGICQHLKSSLIQLSLKVVLRQQL